MKDFSNASFSPDAIQLIDTALQGAVDLLPEPVSSHVIHRLAETILGSLASANGVPELCSG